jgi:histidine phosphotransferase ChpT
MSYSSPGFPAADALTLARLLVSRLTHDLGSPLGTLAGMLDMLEGGSGDDAEMLAVAKEASDQLRGRLRLKRAAWGLGAEPTDLGGLRELLAGAAAAQRVEFDFTGRLFVSTLPAALVPLLLNGALLAAEALPRGGLVRISGEARELAFLPEGRHAAWAPETLAAFAGDLQPALAAGPRQTVAPLLLALTAEQGFEATLAPGAGTDLPALLLTRQGWEERRRRAGQ